MPYWYKTIHFKSIQVGKWEFKMWIGGCWQWGMHESSANDELYYEVSIYAGYLNFSVWWIA